MYARACVCACVRACGGRELGGGGLGGCRRGGDATCTQTCLSSPHTDRWCCTGFTCARMDERSDREETGAGAGGERGEVSWGGGGVEGEWRRRGSLLSGSVGCVLLPISGKLQSVRLQWPLEHPCVSLSVSLCICLSVSLSV